jgi:hypothetical protein
LDLIDTAFIGGGGGGPGLRILEKGDLFFEKLKKNCDFKEFVSPFFEIKVIKIVASRTRRFLDGHL